MKSETSSQNSNSEHTQEVANNMAVVFADQIRKGLITYCPDGLHPNEVGHKIIADLIVEQYELLHSS